MPIFADALRICVGWMVIADIGGCGRVSFDQHAAEQDAKPPIDSMAASPIDSMAASPIDSMAAPRACVTSYTTMLPNEPGERYRLDMSQQIWSVAKANCEADGAYLAIPDNANELADLWALSPTFTWLGETDQADGSTWITVLGTPATYFQWAAGQPDDTAPGQQCIETYGSGQMDDFFCNNGRQSICECDAAP